MTCARSSHPLWSGGRALLQVCREASPAVERRRTPSWRRRGLPFAHGIAAAPRQRQPQMRVLSTGLQQALMDVELWMWMCGDGDRLG